MSDTVMAGFARGVITPKLGGPMAGYAARSGGAVGLHDDLYAHVAVLKCRSSCIVIVNLDLLEVSSALVEELKNSVQERVAVPNEAILVCATHTHSGPDTCTDNETSSEVVKHIVEVCKDALGKAVMSMQAVKVRSGSTFVGGIAKDRGSLQDSPDQSVNYVGFFAGSELVGCFVNFALHPTILGAENMLISADYPGYIREYIAQHHDNCQTVFLNGATGNINIGYSADASALGELIDFRTFVKAKQVGYRIAEVLLTGLSKEQPGIMNTLVAYSEDILLPLKKLPSVALLEQQIGRYTQMLREICEKTQQAREISIKKIYLECMLKAVHRFGITDQRELTIPLQVLVIGSVVLVAIPGELFVESGLAIKQGWEDKMVMVVCYANGSFGYMPSSDAYEKGGYEAETAIFDKTVGDVLVHSVREMIRKAESAKGDCIT